MRTLIAAVTLLSTTALAHADEALDGKVKGLNPATFAALKVNTSPGTTLRESDARAIVAAIKKPLPGESVGTIDDKEGDLLNELTQSLYRRIFVTIEGSDAAELVTYPTSGAAKRVFQEALDPPLNMETAWSEDASGFNKIVAYYKKSPIRRAKVLAFVKLKLKQQMDVSDMKNAYKPLRDEIGRRYAHSGTQGADTSTGRTILYKSLNDLDFEGGGTLPDFLYSWLRPAGYTDPAPRPSGMLTIDEYNKAKRDVR